MVIETKFTIKTQISVIQWHALTPLQQAARIEALVSYAPDSQYKRNELRRARGLRERAEKEQVK